MAFRRKRPRVVWLPPDRLNRLGVAPAAVSSSTQPGVGQLAINITGPLGTPAVEVVPIVLDKTPELALTAGVQSLADVTQSSYRLRRIVGKIFVSMTQEPGDGPPQPRIGLLNVGLIILRINEEDSQPLQNAAQYDSTSYGNYSDPWIWRRSWILSNELNVRPPGANASGFQGVRSNIDCGSVSDGPHVDAKTARIVGPEERLFLVATTLSLDSDAAGQVSQVCQIVFDLRVLGSMKANVGNRRNASR